MFRIPGVRFPAGGNAVDCTFIVRNALVPLYLLCLFLSWPGHLQSGDNGVSVATARALAFEGTWLIDSANEPDLGLSANGASAGKSYGRFGIGLALLYVPFWWLISVIPVAAGDGLVTHLVFSSIPPLFGITNALALYGIFRLLEVSRERAILLALIGSGFTLCFRYSVHDHSEIVQAAVFSSALFLIMRGGRWDLSFAFALLGFSVWIKAYNLAIVGMYGLFAVSREQDWRSRFRVGWQAAIPLILFLLIALALNFLRFGDPLETGYGSEAGKFSFSYLGRDWWRLLFSMEMGFFVFNPVLLCASASILIGVRRRDRIALLAIGVFLFLYLLSGFFAAPKGAWSLGPRYMVPAIPLLCVGLSMSRFDSAVPRLMLVGCVILAGLLNPVFIFVKTDSYDTLRYSSDAGRGEFAPQMNGLFRMLYWKAVGNDGRYPVGLFSDQAEGEIIDLTGYESFSGVNTFYSHAFRRLGYDFPGTLVVLHLTLFLLLITLLAWGCWALLPADSLTPRAPDTSAGCSR